jgi:uncharacterized membrane protein
MAFSIALSVVAKSTEIYILAILDEMFLEEFFVQPEARRVNFFCARQRQRMIYRSVLDICFVDGRLGTCYIYLITICADQEHSDM